MGKNMFDKRSVFIVTGANRGLGKSFAINFACKAAKSSVIVLLARNIASLKEVEAEINSKCPDLNVICNQYDQADLKKVESTLEKIFRDGNLDKESYEQAVIIHNAGTLGDNGKFARDFDNVEELKSYFNTNLTGVMLLTSAFMKLFPQDRFKQRHIINISSLNAIKAVKSFSLYCTGKAARDMYFQVVAEEEQSIRVLNYAPGPCKTDMQKQCRTDSKDQEVKQMFQSLHDNGQVVECDDSAQKLIKLLEADNFTSGAHVDYYDIE